MKPIQKRKAYVKQISESIYHVCLEYGHKVKLSDLPNMDKKEIELKGLKDTTLTKDYVLKKFRSPKKELNYKYLNDAILFKNSFNDKVL